MNAPLSLFLTQFGAPARLPVEVAELTNDLPEFEPDVRLSAEALAAEIAEAVAAARAEAHDRHQAEIADLVASHEAESAQALEAARAAWAETTAGTLATDLSAAMSELRQSLAERVAAVLRPLLVEAVRSRVQTELLEAIDRLVADPTQPLLRVCGPADMEAALRAARPAVAFEWVVAETMEIAIIADAARVETKLAAALDALATTET